MDYRCAGEGSATRSDVTSITTITLIECVLRLCRYCTPCIMEGSKTRVSYWDSRRTNSGTHSSNNGSYTMPKNIYGLFGMGTRRIVIFARNDMDRCLSSQLAARSIGTTWERHIMCWRSTNCIMCLLSAQFAVPKGCTQAHVLGTQLPRRSQPRFKQELDHNPSCAADQVAIGIVVRKSAVMCH